MTNANDLFTANTCADYYYKHLFGGQYTSGVQEFADTTQSHWFIDAIFSHQSNKVKENPFQLWKIIRVVDSEFLLECSDGNGNIIVTQHIPYSDFKYDLGTLWLIDGVLILPSEY